MKTQIQKGRTESQDYAKKPHLREMGSSRLIVMQKNWFWVQMETQKKQNKTKLISYMNTLMLETKQRFQTLGGFLHRKLQNRHFYYNYYYKTK